MRVLLASATVAALLTAGLRGQATYWTTLWLQSKPGPRTAAPLVDDQARQRVVLFGGKGGTTALADTWLWSGTWTQAQPANSPAPRWDHALAYDAPRQRVVLFGGADASTAFGDLWEWDGSNWSQVGFATGPQARGGHTMSYDAARQQVILFGGGSNGVSLADTWGWNGTTWSQFAPSASPPARSQHAMAYDPVRQRIVISGGHSGPTVLGDAWEWDGTNWTQSAPLPVAAGTQAGRLWHAMVWHPPTQRMVLAFGAAISGGFFTDLGDTWAYDGSGWTPTSNSGPSMLDHGVAFDPATQRLVTFGGQRVTSWTALNLTSVYGGAPALASSYGTGCGSPPMSLIPAAPGDRPLIGTTAVARVPAPPSPLVAVVFGSSNQNTPSTPLPLSLASLGMAGCWLWHAADLGSLATVPTQYGLEVQIAVPPSTSLIGAELHLQAFGQAPGQNVAGFITSNALRWVIGSA